MKGILVVLTCCWITFSTAQEEPSIPVISPYKNTLKINPTPTFLLRGNNITVGYERIVKPYQSFSVHMGPGEAPGTFPRLDSAILSRTNRKWGFIAAADYRFYLGSRNKRPAPDGLYWGPYLTSYYFFNELNLSGTFAQVQGNIELEADIFMINAGVQLGYQFVIKDRFVVDLVLVGPGFGAYSTNVNLITDGELTSQELREIKDALLNQFPILGSLASQLTVNNTNFSWGVGFRYLVAIGYRF
jgi:hypothetical protein